MRCAECGRQIQNQKRYDFDLCRSWRQAISLMGQANSSLELGSHVLFRWHGEERCLAAAHQRARAERVRPLSIAILQELHEL